MLIPSSLEAELHDLFFIVYWLQNTCREEWKALASIIILQIFDMVGGVLPSCLIYFVDPMCLTSPGNEGLKGQSLPVTTSTDPRS